MATREEEAKTTPEITPEEAKTLAIRKEKNRIRRVFRDLDKNKLATVAGLIESAAFMTVSLRELEEIINAEGYTDTYQNGPNQYGVKQSEAVKTHIQMTKNLAQVIKQLTDLVPPERQKASRLQLLRDS